MQRLLDSFAKLHKTRALVIGDFMLDIYIRGSVERISPEAPVPILKVNSQELRVGGAGNVIMNLLALDAEVVALGRIGDDNEGSQIELILQEKGVSIPYIYKEKGFVTPTKSRLIGDSQQLYRIDKESINPIAIDIEEKILATLPSVISETKIVVISDYKKGTVSTKILQSIFTLSKENNIPVIIDPKGDNFREYKGAYLIKPNLKEAYIAARVSMQSPLEEVAKILIKQTQVKYLLITRSEKGISLFQVSDETRKDFPVYSREVKDVTGAGDSVLAMLAVSIANHISMDNAVKLANISGALAIERIGCVSITLTDIAECILHEQQREQRDNVTFGMYTKSFWDSEEDLCIIKKLLPGYQIIIINSKETMFPLAFDILLTKKEKRNTKIIVYLQGEQKQFSKFSTRPYYLLYSLGFIVIGGNASLSSLREIFGEENISFLKHKELEKELIYQ